MQNINIAKDIAMLNTAIEFLKMDESLILAILHVHSSRERIDLLKRVQSLIKRAQILLKASTKKLHEAKEHYKMIVIECYVK